MDRYEEIIKTIIETVQANVASSQAAADSHDHGKNKEIPVGISNRHVHLSQADLETLFGTGYQLSKMKDLSQTGQYACKETLTICGPKGAVEKVRILGPVRNRTQVEVMAGDCIKLGIKAEIRLSADLDHTPGITLIGPKGSVQIPEGVIVAQRHIHMHPSDAQRLNVTDGQSVSIRIPGQRGGIYDHVMIRVTGESTLECHIDIEEANAMNLNSVSTITII